MIKERSSSCSACDWAYHGGSILPHKKTAWQTVAKVGKGTIEQRWLPSPVFRKEAVIVPTSVIKSMVGSILWITYISWCVKFLCKVQYVFETIWASFYKLFLCNPVLKILLVSDKLRNRMMQDGVMQVKEDKTMERESNSMIKVDAFLQRTIRTRVLSFCSYTGAR